MTHSSTATLRARAGFAVLAVGAVALVGCTTGNGTPSGTVQSGATAAGATGGPSSAESMSGGYRVGADGKLLKPDDGPVPVPPSTPASIGEDTPEAAEEFARHFVSVAEYAWNSGDTTELRAISTSDCEMCTSMADAIEARYSAGGWSSGLEYEVTETEHAVEHPALEDGLIVVMHVTANALATYDGSRISSFNNIHDLIELHACKLDGRWSACGGVGARDPDKD